MWTALLEERRRLGYLGDTNIRTLVICEGQVKNQTCLRGDNRDVHLDRRNTEFAVYLVLLFEYCYNQYIYFNKHLIIG